MTKVVTKTTPIIGPIDAFFVSIMKREVIHVTIFGPQHPLRVNFDFHYGILELTM